MKKTNKKIYYINGYNESVYTGTKYKELSKLLNEDIVLAEYKYNENNLSEIEEKVKNADVIIASSTGAYLARNICYKHNIPLISLNPVIDLEKTFNDMNVEVPNIENGDDKNLKELILVTKDDELIPYMNTIKKYPLKSVIIEEGGHKFEKVNLAIPYINTFLNSLFI